MKKFAPAWLDRMYNNRALVPDHAEHFSRWAANSLLARAQGPCSIQHDRRRDKAAHGDVLLRNRVEQAFGIELKHLIYGKTVELSRDIVRNVMGHIGARHNNDFVAGVTYGSGDALPDNSALLQGGAHKGYGNDPGGI